MMVNDNLFLICSTPTDNLIGLDFVGAGSGGNLKLQGLQIQGNLFEGHQTSTNTTAIRFPTSVASPFGGINVSGNNFDGWVTNITNWNAAWGEVRHNAPDSSDYGDWDYVITKTANQTVTNNATLQDDTDLQFPCLTNELWHVELALGMDGSNTTGDGKVGLTASGPAFVTTQSNWSGVYYNGSSTLTNTAPTAFASTTEAVTGGTVCLNGDGTVWPVRMLFELRCSAGATIKVQFANSSASAGRTTTMHAGSRLLAKKISP